MNSGLLESFYRSVTGTESGYAREGSQIFVLNLTPEIELEQSILLVSTKFGTRGAQKLRNSLCSHEAFLTS